MVVQKEDTKHVHAHIKRSDNDTCQRDFFRNRVSVKLGQKAKNLETRLEKLDDIARPELEKHYDFKLDGAVHRGKLIVAAHDIHQSFGKHPILRGIDLEVRGNTHIHIRGLNGSGKSTFVRLLAHKLEPTQGSIEYGNDVKIGYFSQDTDGINYEQTALENLLSSRASQEDIYRRATSLGIDAKSLPKMPAELSRGQQSKLAFTKLLLTDNDMLLLDEPTNHLDIRTKEQLETALKEYAGAILVASHDVYFLRQLTIDTTLLLNDGKLTQA